MTINKILLVDDAEISNYIMKKSVGKILPDVAVYDYTKPKEAFSALEDISPDIIFLDLNMPELNGWQFLDLLKKQANNYKIIILTSSTSTLDRERAQNYNNIIGYLTKPIRSSEIKELLQKM